MPNASRAAGAESPGTTLIAASLGAVAGVAAGNLAPAPVLVAVPLSALALAALACGLRRHPRGARVVGGGGAAGGTGGVRARGPVTRSCRP
jgi:hypothetical protein